MKQRNISLELPCSEWQFLLTLCVVMQMKYERKRKDKEENWEIAKRIDGIREKIVKIVLRGYRND